MSYYKQSWRLLSRARENLLSIIALQVEFILVVLHFVV